MPQGHIDAYTRIEILLPFKKQEEIQAARDVINYVQNLRDPNGRYHYRGMTYSAQLPTVFQGAWRNSRGKWVIDRLVILILDLAIDYSDYALIAQEADTLKQQTHNFYINARATQKDIWVNTYAIGHVQ